MRSERKILRVLAATLVVGACGDPAARSPSAALDVPEQPEPAAADGVGDEHSSLDAVTWMRLSAEYEVITQSTYAAAKRSLDLALQDPEWTASLEQSGEFSKLKPAVILDVDETALDNSPYAAWRIKHQRPFEAEAWNRWCDAARADPVPGALDFTQYAAGRGVTVFYVTNRDAPAEKGTLKNLLDRGFPVDAEGEQLMLRGEKSDWASDKGTRRRVIGEGHRILLLIGDNLGDFVDGAKASDEQRDQLVQQNSEYWGTRWFMLPNPDYGSWEDPIYDSPDELPLAEQTRKKLDALQTWDG
jgi:acid phosphatase